MADFRDTTVSRRGLGAAGALAAVLPLVGAAPGPSPILRQAQRIAALYEAEGVACILFSRAEGSEDEAAADAAVRAAYAEWEVAAFVLAALPAEGPQDILAKLALVLQALRGGPGEAEGKIATSLLHDLWRLTPELRPLLRWSPLRPEFLT